MLPSSQPGQGGVVPGEEHARPGSGAVLVEQPRHQSKAAAICRTARGKKIGWRRIDFCF